MIKKILLGIILVLMLPIVYSINAGEDWTIFNVAECYGDINIKVRQNNKTDDYLIKDCSHVNKTRWICKCNKDNTPIVLQTFNTTKNIYDIVLEYYRKPTYYLNELDKQQYKRTENLNDIKVGYEIKPVKKSIFEWPEIKTSTMSIIIFIIFILIIIIFCIIYIISKIILNDEENKIEKTRDVSDSLAPYKIEPNNDEKLSKNEINEYIKNL